MFDRARRALRAGMKAGIQAMRQPGGMIFTGAAQTEAGVMVSDDSAMRFATVHACIRVLSEDIAALPMHVYRRTDDGGKERDRDNPLYELLHDRPNSEMSAVSFREALMVNALLTGNGYAFIEFGRSGRVLGMYPLLSSEVTPYRSSSGAIRYRVGGEDLAANEVFHLAGLGFDGLIGLSPIAYARESIGLGMAAERFGEKFFKNGTHIGGLISVDGVLDPDAFERTRAQFAGMFKGLQNAHGVPVLEGGAKYTPVGIAPEDAQFLETRKFQRSEIAAIYRVPPHMIGDLERATFSNIEQQDLAYLQRALLPWLMRIEQEVRAKLIRPEDRARVFAEHDTANFMRGETASRMQAYSTAIMAGIMTPNEARSRENLNPMEGGDTILLPLNMVQGDEAQQKPDARSRIWRDFKPRGAAQRAAGEQSIAAQMAGLGVGMSTLRKMQEGFSAWLAGQADDIEAIMEECGFTSGSRSAEGGELRAIKQGDRNRLWGNVCDYYKLQAEKGTEALAETIGKGELPGWRTVNEALDQISKDAWDKVASELGKDAPDAAKIKTRMDKYRAEMALRLCTANQNELERAMQRADGQTDEALFDEFMGIMTSWRSHDGDGKGRSGIMARTEVAMMRNDAMICAYEDAGYRSIWQSAPGCCKICTAMHDRTVTTLKPPLHKGCACGVRKGDKI